MTKPLLYYCGNTEDEAVLRELEGIVSAMSTEDRLMLAYGALGLCAKPEVPFPFPIELSKELELVFQLTEDSKRQLVRALIDNYYQHHE